MRSHSTQSVSAAGEIEAVSSSPQSTPSPPPLSSSKAKDGHPWRRLALPLAHLASVRTRSSQAKGWRGRRGRWECRGQVVACERYQTDAAPTLLAKPYRAGALRLAGAIGSVILIQRVRPKRSSTPTPNLICLAVNCLLSSVPQEEEGKAETSATGSSHTNACLPLTPLPTDPPHTGIVLYSLWVCLNDRGSTLRRHSPSSGTGERFPTLSI